MCVMVWLIPCKANHDLGVSVCPTAIGSNLVYRSLSRHTGKSKGWAENAWQLNKQEM